MKLCRVADVPVRLDRFPDQLIGASLKLVSGPAYPAAVQRFPDQLIGASLKPGTPLRLLRLRLCFPDQLIGASLKHPNYPRFPRKHPVSPIS